MLTEDSDDLAKNYSFLSPYAIWLYTSLYSTLEMDVEVRLVCIF